MIYRRFGKTGLSIPVFSVGMMRSMHSWQDTPLDTIPEENQSNLFDLVSSALGVGLNHFETARGYGSSERQLGEILRQFPRKDYILQTKVSPADDPETFISHVNESLQRLQVESVDLLAIHGINDFRSLWQVCRKGGCLAAARQLQDQGTVGAVGFSGHGPVDVLSEALEFHEYGGFDYLNLHWYTIFQVNDPILALAAQNDLGVFIISPSDKGGMLQSPPAKLKKLCQPLTPMQFNDLYCLGRSEIHTISIGAATAADFEAHMKIIPELKQEDGFVTSIYKKLQWAMFEVSGHDRPDWHWPRI